MVSISQRSYTLRSTQKLCSSGNRGHLVKCPRQDKCYSQTVKSTRFYHVSANSNFFGKRQSQPHHHRSPPPRSYDIPISIPQPRSALFALFDHLIPLSAGNGIYDGAAGQSVDDYFGLLGFKCPDMFNFADFLLDVLSMGGDAPKQINENGLSGWIVSWQHNGSGKCIE